ncbi:MAG: hypothetical protein ACERKD_23750 [Prolixibacteraceae bacterium]
MKKYIFLIGFAFFVGMNGFGQNYVVLKKWGTPLVNQQNIQRGDSLNAASSIQFLNDGEKLIVANSQGNLFWCEAPKGPAFSLDQTLRAINVKRSRGFKVKNSGVYDFKNYFGDEVFTLLNNEIIVPVDLNSFPLNNAHFIVFFYKLKDQSISRKIGFDNQKLILQKNALLNLNGQIVDQEQINNVEVYEYYPNSGQSNLLTTVNFQFADEPELINELRLLSTYIQNQDELKPYILETYLTNAYGKLDGIQEIKIKEELNQALQNK